MTVAAEVLNSINNHFEQSPARGSFVVEGGTLSAVQGELPTLAAGQYYLVQGSVLNDGLHQQGAEDLADEAAWDGEIVPCAVPRDLLDVIQEIADYREVNGVAAGPYQSESFDGYSYSRGTDAEGKAIDWRSAFRNQLNRWRKL